MCTEWSKAGFSYEATGCVIQKCSRSSDQTHLRKMPTTSVSITIYDSQQKFGIFLILRQSG